MRTKKIMYDQDKKSNGPAIPHSPADLRTLLIAEQASDWEALLAPLATPRMHIDAIDSALNGLVALRQAAMQAQPFRVVMLGHAVQGMEAAVLSAAIKGDANGRETILVCLSQRQEDDAQALARAGFSALIHRNAASDAISKILDRVCTAAAQRESLPFLSTRHPPAPAPKRVLIADDNPVNREVAAGMLRKLGFECGLAADGREAVEMHRTGEYDVILMDCEMPELDGLQATKLIRSSEQPDRRTPVIALTAATAQEERERCLAAGMDDFLSKPIRPQVLQDVMARWLPATPTSSQQSDATSCEDELESVRDMFGADFAELVAIYQRDSPPRIAALHQARCEGNSALVAKVAHAFSGSSASIGATGLADLCKGLEIHARTGMLDEFESRMAAVETEYRRISGKLQSLLQ